MFASLISGCIRFTCALRFDAVEKLRLQGRQNVRPLWLLVWFCRDFLEEKLFSQ